MNLHNVANLFLTARGRQDGNEAEDLVALTKLLSEVALTGYKQAMKEMQKVVEDGLRRSDA